MPDNKRAIVVVLQLAILIALIGAWEIAARLQWMDPFFFSQPSIFAARALRWLAEPGFLLGGRTIYYHLLVTMEEMLPWRSRWFSLSSSSMRIVACVRWTAVL